MKYILTVLSSAFTACASVLYLDVRGDRSTVDGVDFGEWFVNNTVPGRAESEDGIDIVAVNEVSEVLDWIFFDESLNSFRSKYGAYLLSDGGGFDYPWSSRANQIDVNGSQTVRLLAGYFDWDNVDWDVEFDQSKFVPYAYAEISGSDLYSHTYEIGSIAPMPAQWEPTEWHSMNGAVPEPACRMLLLAGLCVFAARRRRL